MLPTGLRQLLDPCEGHATAGVIVQQPGSRWPEWLLARLPGAPAVIIVNQEPGEPAEHVRARLRRNIAACNLVAPWLDCILLCAHDGPSQQQDTLAAALLEEIVRADGGRLTVFRTGDPTATVSGSLTGPPRMNGAEPAAWYPTIFGRLPVTAPLHGFTRS